MQRFRCPTHGPFLQRAARQNRPCHLSGDGSGSADLITLRGLAALQSADVIYHDRLADPALLQHAKRRARCISARKAKSNHCVPQDGINQAFEQSAQLGLTVGRLKCGDPGVFGRSAEEAAALTEAGVGLSIIPGVTAACAACAAAGATLACYLGVSTAVKVQRGLIAAGWPESSVRLRSRPRLFGFPVPWQEFGEA